MEITIKNDLSIQEYNNLRSSVNWNSKDEELIQNAINNSAIIKTASIGSNTIGMARVIGDGIYYFLVDVVVIPEYQKKGIGKMLLDEIIKEVENKTKKGQTSSINLVSINGIEGFYEKCGFKKIPHEYHGYGMIKRIKK